MADSAKWYVIHTYSGYENKVANNIETVVENRQMQDQILEVKIPMETVTEIKDNKKRDVERKVFPGYVLVKLAVDVEDGEYVMSDDTWYVIRNTRGVTGFVGPESKPIRSVTRKCSRLGWRKGRSRWPIRSAILSILLTARSGISPVSSRRSIRIKTLSA